MKRRILPFCLLAGVLLSFLLFVTYKQSEWTLLSDYIPKLNASSVQSIELYRIGSDVEYPSKKKTENQDNISELLDILGQFSIRRTEQSMEETPFYVGGPFFIRLRFENGENLSIRICGLLSFSQENIVYELKGNQDMLWETCASAEEVCSWEEVPGQE